MTDKELMNTEERREALEHRDVLLHLRQIMKTDSGKFFMKYLFKNYGVSELPPLGLDGPMLHDRIGSLRAGQAMFALASEADPETAANLLAQTVKEKNAELYNEAQIQRN